MVVVVVVVVVVVEKDEEETIPCAKCCALEKKILLTTGVRRHAVGRAVFPSCRSILVTWRRRGAVLCCR